MEGGALEAEGRESRRAWKDMGSVPPKGHRRQAGQECSDQQGEITGALGAIPGGAEEKRSKEPHPAGNTAGFTGISPSLSKQRAGVGECFLGSLPSMRKRA